MGLQGIERIAIMTVIIYRDNARMSYIVKSIIDDNIQAIEIPDDYRQQDQPLIALCKEYIKLQEFKDKFDSFDNNYEIKHLMGRVEKLQINYNKQVDKNNKLIIENNKLNIEVRDLKDKIDKLSMPWVNRMFKVKRKDK